MKVSVSTISMSELDVDVLVLPVSVEDVESGLADLTEQFGETVDRIRLDFGGKVGESAIFYPDSASTRRVLVIGYGEADGVDAERIRRASSEGATAARKLSVETAAIVVPKELPDAEIASQALVEGFILGSYRFDRYKTAESDESNVQRLVVQTSDSDVPVRRGAERGRVVAESVCSARDLVNLSPDEKTPTLFSKAIEKSAKKYGYDASVWDKEMITEEGMNGLLAVNRGSIEPPTFTVLEWRPEHARNKKPIVLVGKGVVFDTGGLSLKSTLGSMDSMKSDMAGAAAVVGTMEAIARLDLPVFVIGLIPATDNRPGEAAYVPGDVIRMHSGKTVEVLNTDAEGRIILADALSYAGALYPELVIDLATLTGAIVVALGDSVAGVMTNARDDADGRVKAMVDAGTRSGDLVHPMPMHADYADLIKSEIADLKNVGGRAAGAITAAKFLEAFVDYPWVHLDIAGPAFLEKKQPYRGVGGTGFGVRLLVEFLRDYAHQKRS
jgi:leucyl aminopeptidase